MDLVALLFIVAQAVVLAFLAGQVIVRGRQLDQVRDALRAVRRPGWSPEAGASGEIAEPASDVRRLGRDVARLAWELDQHQRDTAYLADLVGVGIVHVDDDLRVDLANAAAHVFVGRVLGSMVGRTAMEAFVDGRIEAIVAAARERGAGSGEVTPRDSDGGALVIRARRSPIRGIWVVLEDVAELRRLQRIRSEFIDNLSHELRTPLTTVGLLAEALSRDAEVAGPAIPARMRERIAKVEIETGHLTQMVSELLDLSAIESGSSQLHLDDVDLGEVAAASVERLRLFGERNGVRLVLEPAGRRSPPVRGDAARLGQVFVNLLHNAVKFSPTGGTVTVRVARAGDDVVASVEDHGVGIPKADQARIFERFYKVDRARGRAGGTGLGLAIARHVIEGHGGRIWVESEEGRGSVFFFAVPLAPPVPVPVPGLAGIAER